VQPWKHTGTKTHTASLLAKPTPLNINLGSVRSAMFNKERDIPRFEGRNCRFNDAKNVIGFGKGHSANP
jgi:hypothetical protein